MSGETKELFGYEEYPKNESGEYIMAAKTRQFISPWFKPNEQESKFRDFAIDLLNKHFYSVNNNNECYKYERAFLIRLFTFMLAYPKRPILFGKVSEFYITRGQFMEIMKSIEKCGLCSVIHGNPEVGHEPYYKFWFPTITREIKSEILDRVKTAKTKELDSLIYN
ncbi:hypothetical protein [Pseudoalteromonas rhizosphaerae]|uniref:hypothetical protein n=1 Tax=Pseudoalteromonas rhizosphaerae TaxID=2518973 RepID=UPI003704B875